MMKKTGRNLENEISKKLLKINKAGRGFFIKSPTPMKMIKSEEKIIPIYSNKAFCDFVGIYKSKFVLIEAKNISGTRFVFDRLKEHQEKQLSAIKRYGGSSFLMFGINEENIVVVLEIEDYLVFKSQTDKKSISIENIKEIGRIVDIEKIEEYLDFAV